MTLTVCPFCRRQPVNPRWRPFCSARCQMQDLSRWADGSYAVPGGEVPDQDQDDAPVDESKN